MPISPDMSAIEAISTAIKAEIEMRDLYKKFENKTKNSRLKAQFNYLAKEEEKHRELFQEVFSREFPGKELQLPAESIVPTIERALNEDMEPKELFQVAMESEQMAKNFYKVLTQYVKDEKAKALLNYLSNVEQNHYNMLKADYELLLEIPDYFEVDELIKDDWNLAQ